MKSGDIIGYRDMCNAENTDTLQRGMNYRLHPTHSVLLMSTRENAPYEDEVQNSGMILIYEGHDINKTQDIDDPKKYDQPMYTVTGKLTQNGLFHEAAKEYKSGERSPELVHVYEKIKSGIWAYNGQFNLIDAWQETSNGRLVFKFQLQATDIAKISEEINVSVESIEHTRVIPSNVKMEVWKRDEGKCVICGSTKNLHFDHIIPYSRGGTSLSAKNIQLLCMACNLAKRDRIE